MEIEVFRRIQFLRHGNPETNRCGREYDSVGFNKFRGTRNIRRLCFTTSDDKAGELDENRSQTLHSFFNRPQLCGKGSLTESIVPEATLRKSLSLGLDARPYSRFFTSPPTTDAHYQRFSPVSQNGSTER